MTSSHAVAAAKSSVLFTQPRTLKAHGYYENASAFWAVLLADVFMLELCLMLGFVLRLSLGDYFPAAIGPEQVRGLIVGVLLIPVFNIYARHYPGYFLSPVERLRRRSYTTIGVFGALTAWDSVVLDGTWSRGIILSTMVLSLIVPVFGQALVRRFLIAHRLWGKPVVILGAGATGENICRQLLAEKEYGLVPVCLLDDDPARQGIDIEGVPVIGPLSMAPQLDHYVSVAITAIPSLRSEDLARLVRRLPFARVVVIPDLFGIGTQWITARDMGGCLGLEIQRNLHVPRNRALKRLLDYAIGIPCFLASVPLIAVMALWIRRVSPGSAFYSQEREGFNGRPIRIWKLRSMQHNADALLADYLRTNPEADLEWRRHFKLKHDPRLLPVVGKLLRRTSLDELPQLWNVLIGDMSLVGPRPFPHYHLDRFEPEFRQLRSSVLPGLTGFWQVSGRSNGDLKVQERLDTYYIRNWSLWLDLWLLIRTTSAVIAGSGAY